MLGIGRWEMGNMGFGRILRARQGTSPALLGLTVSLLALSSQIVNIIILDTMYLYSTRAFGLSLFQHCSQSRMGCDQ